MPTDRLDLRDRLGRVKLRAAERFRVLADHLVHLLGLEVELGVGELGRLRILEVTCDVELADLVLEVVDVDSGALEVLLGGSGARVRRGGGRGAFPIAFSGAIRLVHLNGP